VRTASKNGNIELVTVYEVSKILNSSLDLPKTMRNLLNVLSTHLQMQRGMVALLQEDGYLQVIAATGMNKEESALGRFRSGEGVMGNILKSGMPAVVPDITQEALFLNRTGSRRATIPAARHQSSISLQLRPRSARSSSVCKLSSAVAPASLISSMSW